MHPHRLLGPALALALAEGALACSSPATLPANEPGGAASDAGTGSGGDAGHAAGGAGAAHASCGACAEPTDLAVVAAPAVDEASGIVASAQHPGVYYVHNDSGDSARFFAIDEAGADRGTFVVSNAKAVDWEDVARGPCAAGSGSCLYFADMGDNARVRSDYVIYRVVEPTTLGGGTVTADALPFAYPDGSHNAEALVVHPTTGVLTIITKTTETARVFELPMPLTPGVKVTAIDRGPFKVPSLFPLVTAADVHPSGSSVLVRTYGDLWLYTAPAGGGVAEALATTPCAAPVALEAQGEAVGFLASGAGWLTMSEGTSPTLHRVLCAP
jgi:hypothetical protein